MFSIKDKNIIVVGGGVSGIAAAKLGVKKGAHVLLLEKKSGVVDCSARKFLEDRGVEIREGEHRPEDFSNADLIVLSPGVPIYSIKNFVKEDTPLISEIEFGYWFLKDEKIIGITGTNGKTTTVGLISWVFTKCNIDHFVGGNYGIPLCEYILQDKKDIVLLELSSFQLQNIIHFRANIGVFLNFSENHLDYHKDMNEYLMCKMNIFKNQTKEDVAILNKSLKNYIKDYNINARKIFFSKSSIKIYGLVGEHNLENIDAAFCVCKEFGIDRKKFIEASCDFSPFPHRIEYVGEINGVKFYNDSKSTTLESIKAAVNSFDKSVFLIVGGILKGGDPENIVDSIKDRLSRVCVYGKSRDVFFDKWKRYFPVHKVNNIQDASMLLFSYAKEGDIILFSPGCSSFDMFTNYKERGNHFKEIVKFLSLKMQESINE